MNVSMTANRNYRVYVRPSVPVRVFKIRDRKVFLHVHDAFDPSEHPHAGKGSSKGGQFVAKGTGGGGTTTKATKKPTPRIPRGQATAGFQPIEKGEKGFSLPGGAELPKHIAALGRIPPAWTQVRYNPDPKGSLLVVGRDAKGKQQPLYSEKHKTSQAANKFGRIQRLEPKFDAIMAKNKKMQSDKNPRVRDAASALALVMHTGMRPGSESDTGADYKSYGATTLEGQHIITDENGDIVVRFVSGKNKGKEIDMKVTDPDLAKNLQQRAKQAGSGKPIFPDVNERGLLNHAKGLAGAGFKTKDFRTLLGTKTGADEVKKMPVPKTPAEFKKFAMAVATIVSKKLGNTPAIAMKDYISPHVFADWRLASGA